MPKRVLEFEIILSRAMIFALRHAPEAWGIVLDGQGWTDVGNLIETIGLADSRLAFVRNRDLRQLARKQSSRFELQGTKIRALYGHSVSIDCGADEPPPEYLLHMTTSTAWASILREGLTPQRRLFVHLTTSRSYASLIGEKSKSDCLMVVVAAARAHMHGQRFWRANESIWLTERLSQEYLHLDLKSAENLGSHASGLLSNQQ